MNKLPWRTIFVVTLATIPLGLAAHSNAAASGVTVARFHLALSKAEPAVNDTVNASPKSIKLWFTEPVQLAATGIKITGAAKHDVPLGALSIAAAAKSPAVAEIKEALKPGKYTVAWKTMAADGHPNKGTFVFTVGMKAAQ